MICLTEAESISEITVQKFEFPILNFGYLAVLVFIFSLK